MMAAKKTAQDANIVDVEDIVAESTKVLRDEYKQRPKRQDPTTPRHLQGLEGPLDYDVEKFMKKPVLVRMSILQ